MLEPEALSTFAAKDMRVRERTAVRAMIVIGRTILFLHHPGHTTTALED